MSNSSFSHITKDFVARTNRAKLESLREKVDLAEAGLRNARDQYEAEVESQGLSTKGVFSSTFFVRRSSAESWLADAQAAFDRREARDSRELKAALRKIASRDNEDTPAPGKKTPAASDEDFRRAEISHTAALIIRAGEERRRPLPDPVVPTGGTGDAYQDQVNATAAAIIRAGQNRRNGK